MGLSKVSLAGVPLGNRCVTGGWLVMVLFIGTVTVLSSDRYAVESAMVAVIDPSVTDLLVEVAMTTLWVVPVGVRTMALSWVPKFPTHVRFRSMSSRVVF